MGIIIERISAMLRLGWFLFYRDFQWRYRITFLGYFWAVMRPLLIGLPIIVVGKRFNLGSSVPEHVPYELYAFVGLIFFRIFFDTIEYSQMVMWRARKILKEVSFPYIAVLIGAVYYVAFNICVYLTLFLLAGILFKVSLSWKLVAGLLFIPAMVFSGLAIGILFAPLALFYLDIRYGLSLLANILMWATPVFYSFQGQGLLGQVNKWNPISYLIDTPRALILAAGQFHWWGLAISLMLFGMIFAIGVIFFNRAMPIAVERAI